APTEEEGSGDSERPQHVVTVASFVMGKYPVTQAQWQAVAALPMVERELDPDPSYFKGDQRPVENVSWYDAVEFCQRLSQHTGRDFRLPSEA
ncbi:MAG TPA: formylglycine-generating enzyme family protein, partial [Cyanobacteria bacterium UBA8543]|nr:formylglycine-generating enzyme family protein [Cyanobacteria bacterium UBA8543]